MAQSVKLFPRKPEDLTLIHRTCIKKLGLVVYVCNPSSREAETRISLGITGYLLWPTC